MKVITLINRDISIKFLIKKVISIIKEKWLINDIRHLIYIQQDNARCHINENDIKFCRVVKQDGFDI